MGSRGRVEPEWGRIHANLLYSLDIRCVPSPDSDPRIVFSRWKALPPEQAKSRDDRNPRGNWTSFMERREEFLCLMAGLFYQWSEPGSKLLTINYLGSLNDSDEPMRYALYGHAKLTVEQMEVAK